VHSPRRQAGFRKRPRWPPAPGDSQARQRTTCLLNSADGHQTVPRTVLPGNHPVKDLDGANRATQWGRLAGGRYRAGCGHRRPGPTHVRPPTPGALLLAREQHARRADPERAAPPGCPRSTPDVVRKRRRRRPPPVCISWCPRGDTLHTHTAVAVRGGGVRVCRPSGRRRREPRTESAVVGTHDVARVPTGPSSPPAVHDRMGETAGDGGAALASCGDAVHTSSVGAVMPYDRQGASGHGLRGSSGTRRAAGPR
jgi:hypothetical protein